LLLLVVAVAGMVRLVVVALEAIELELTQPFRLQQM
jgi:hypothetical protein